MESLVFILLLSCELGLARFDIEFFAAFVAEDNCDSGMFILDASASTLVTVAVLKYWNPAWAVVSRKYFFKD